MITPQNCAGIAGAWHIDQAAAAVYYLLHGLQHRGSDGAGIAAADGESVRVFKRSGMLSESMKEDRLESLQGNLACGQVRMAAADDISDENLQPVMVRAHQGSFAVCSTGMVSNAPSLRRHMEEDGLIFQGTSDAEIIAHLIQISPGRMKEKIETACQMLKGPYTFVIMTKNTMYGVVSRQAVHSLYYAKCQQGYLFASETSAFAMFETGTVHSIAPGQMIILGKNGFESRQMDFGKKHWCSMEPVYYSREDSCFSGRSIHKYRQALGQALAEKETETADIVIGVPDTALAAASAFARTLKIPYEIGLIKNRYLGSTLVTPAREQREAGLSLRLNAISSIVSGNRVFLVDDSIQKGQTARMLCRMLKAAGASQVHLRIASPRIRNACLYGTEYIPEEDLLAREYTEEEMLEILQADSLRFLDEEAFASVIPPESCMACMNGIYPGELHDFEMLHTAGKEKGNG